jgi:hypothetical protein
VHEAIGKLLLTPPPMAPPANEGTAVVDLARERERRGR